MVSNKKISLKDAEIQKKSLTKHEIYDIIREYTQDQIDLCNRKRGKEENFALPAWSEFQAHQLGIIKGLEKILEFIPNLDQRAKN